MRSYVRDGYQETKQAQEAVIDIHRSVATQLVNALELYLFIGFISYFVYSYSTAPKISLVQPWYVSKYFYHCTARHA